MYESFPTTRFSAFVLSLWTACLATRSFFLHKIVFRKNKMPAILALRVMLGLIHLFQLYASLIDKTILANGIV